MQTKYFVLAAAMVCAVSMNAQTGAQTNINDTLRMDTSMFRIAEVTVEAQSVIQKVDKQVLLPNKEQRKASHDGMSLLQNLQIPRIVVNPADNTVKTLANQDVQLRINGIERCAVAYQRHRSKQFRGYGNQPERCHPYRVP